MGRTLVSFKKKPEVRPMVVTDREKQTDVTLKDFMDLHPKFIEQKTLEGLASRTLRDHEKHMGYFKKYLEEDERSKLDRYVETDIFRGYLAYMVHQTELKPCTINIRLRTLKCYLKWLYDEGYIEFNYSKKLKLVKVPEDTIKPLSDSNVRKMLNAPDRNTYSGYRDFCLMVLMLDCGIRINEAVNLTLNDLDLKARVISVQPETAKTRVFRQLPISHKTCNFLKELVTIAEDNNSTYIFGSLYGGKVSSQNIIASFEKYGKKAGIKVRCTPHVFRHTFATNFIKAGGDMFTLQKILGHSTLVMCRKYIQLENSDLVRKHSQVSLLNKYLI